jgi:predicted aspartyl protease
MGMTHITVEIANYTKPDNREQVEMLVDSGALYSVIPAKVVRKLHIKAVGEESFFLANGDKITRKLGSAMFYYKDHWGPSKIILGEPGDSALMGVVTLESLGFALDPMRRELLPLKMILY